MTDTQFKPGDAVQLRNGWEAEVLDVVEGQEWCVFIKYKDEKRGWLLGTRDENGRECSIETAYDLIHKPKRMSGFVNVYRNVNGYLWAGDANPTRKEAEKMVRDVLSDGEVRIACIDLSQFEEGEGL